MRENGSRYDMYTMDPYAKTWDEARKHRAMIICVG